MKIILISGGFGNQLFQLALFNKVLQQSTCEVYLSTIFYDDQNSFLFFLKRKCMKIPHRKFIFEKELQQYLISRKSILQKCFKSKNFAFIIDLLSNLLPLKFLLRLSKSGFINESSFCNLNSIHSVLFYDGYWQDFKFLCGQESFLRSCLKGKYGQFSSSYSTSGIVLHVRRGDQATFFSKNLYTILDSSFYAKALNYLVSLNVDLTQIIICSDDIDWCKKHLNFVQYSKSIIFSDSMSTIEDFSIMFNSKYLVSSNSTFSFMAGILGHCEKLIIPKDWYVRHPNSYINNYTKIIQI